MTHSRVNAEIIDLGQHLVPYEEGTGEPGLMGAATASNAEYAALVRFPDGKEVLVEVFDEGHDNTGQFYSFRGGSDDQTISVRDEYLFTSYGANFRSDSVNTPKLLGLEDPSWEEAEQIQERYLIEVSLGLQALRASDYWTT